MSRARRIARGLAVALGRSLLALLVVWTVTAIALGRIEPPGLRLGLAAMFATGVAWALAHVKPFAHALLRVAAASLLVVVAFILAPASNEGRWPPDVARITRADIDGDRVRLHDVRDFRWRSDQNYTPRWEDREYRISDLHDVDLVMSYWGPREFCHTFVSFGFADGRRLAISVETRKQMGEEYSAVAGFFRRYTLAYIFADERDLLALRTDVRGEEVFVYRVPLPPDTLRAFFLAYLDETNQLAARPRWYHALADSCGINILERLRDATGHMRWDRHTFLNGRWDELLWAQGRIGPGLSFEELRRRSQVGPRRPASDHLDDYSEQIRAGLPVALPRPTPHFRKNAGGRPGRRDRRSRPHCGPRGARHIRRG